MRFDFGIGRGALLALVAHDVVADSGMTDQVADIDAEIVVELLDILRHRFPTEFNRAQHVHRDRFDIGKKFRQPIRFARPHRGQRQGAIAEDHRRCAMVAGIGTHRVPRHLGVIVAMIVDKTGGHDRAASVYRARGSAAQFAHLDDLAVLDPDIASVGGHPRAIDDTTILD